MKPYEAYTDASVAEKIEKLQMSEGHEWFDVPDGVVNQICCDCGLTHAISIQTGWFKPTRIRFAPYEEMTNELRRIKWWRKK